jgi:hypothetical protein
LSTIPSGSRFSHKPRVKSGIATGMLPVATECDEISIMQLNAAASYTTMSGVGHRKAVLLRLVDREARGIIEENRAAAVQGIDATVRRRASARRRWAM